MNVLRRILGLVVMLAGILGLVLSLAGLVMVWVVKPTVAAHAATTVDIVSESIVASQRAMEITGEALGGTIDSVDALSVMLSTTADTLEDTKPILDEVDGILGITLPSTVVAASDSLHAAQEAAQVLERTIQSLDSFRFLLSTAPLIGDLVGQSDDVYSPEKPLADSLGELASGLEDLPDTFTRIAEDLNTTDDNLVAVQQNLVTMAKSVARISSSLSQYEELVAESQSSMEELTSTLISLQDNLAAILNGAAIVLTLFFAWLLAAQVVILSQGWELYRGTADRLEGEAEPG